MKSLEIILTKLKGVIVVQKYKHFNNKLEYNICIVFFALLLQVIKTLQDTYVHYRHLYHQQYNPTNSYKC